MVCDMWHESWYLNWEQNTCWRLMICCGRFPGGRTSAKWDGPASWNHSFVACFHRCQQSLERQCQHLESSCFWCSNELHLERRIDVFAMGNGYCIWKGYYSATTRKREHCTQKQRLIKKCVLQQWHLFGQVARNTWDKLHWNRVGCGNSWTCTNHNSHLLWWKVYLEQCILFPSLFHLWVSKWMYVEEYFPYWNTR